MIIIYKSTIRIQLARCEYRRCRVETIDPRIATARRARGAKYPVRVQRVMCKTIAPVPSVILKTKDRHKWKTRRRNDRVRYGNARDFATNFATNVRGGRNYFSFGKLYELCILMVTGQICGEHRGARPP